MRIWNSDGGEVESCGNATRCVVAADRRARRSTPTAALLEGEDLGARGRGRRSAEPRFAWDEIPLAYPMDTAALPMAWDGLEQPFAVNVGNPHLVFFVADAREVPLETLGPRIEHDPAFPERINVNVATYVDDRLKLRTFERGAGLRRWPAAPAPARARLRRSQRSARSRPSRVDMTGRQPDRSLGRRASRSACAEPATHVFEGELDLRRSQ